MTKLLGSILVLGASLGGMTIQLRERNRRRRTRLDLLDGLYQQGHTIVLITHDPFVASRAVQRFRVAQGTVRPVLSEHAKAYPS